MENNNFSLSENDLKNEFVKIILDMDFVKNCEDAIEKIVLNVSEYKNDMCKTDNDTYIDTTIYIYCDLSDKNEIFRLDKYSLEKLQNCDYHIYLTDKCIEFLINQEIAD
jgi:hypothetical protein